MKTADEIYAEMCTAFAERSGVTINDGCDMAARLFTAAVQIQSLYIYNDWVKNQCFPQTASGQYLDNHAQMRGLSRNAVVSAVGFIRFRIEALRDTYVTVPEGTICMTSAAVRFVTTADAVIRAGEAYCDAPAKAIKGGVSGNAAEKSIIFMVSAPVGISSCTNIERFSGGTDTESDESLRERVISSYSGLPNGANRLFYESVVLDVDDVAAVHIVPKARGLGTMDVIVAGIDGIPSKELLSTVQTKLRGIREMCVDISVKKPEAVNVDLNIRIDIEDGWTFQDTSNRVRYALEEYFCGKRLGESIYLAKLGDIVFGIAGIRNYKILAPTVDVLVENGELPVISSLNITEWS